MEPYTDHELEAMVGDLESDLVERKESFSGEATKRAREAVCAFANDLPAHGRPGVLFVGVRDDGTPAGLDVDDRLLLSLASMKTDGNIVPPPTLTVSKRRLRGHEFAVVTVWPSDSPPARYQGRIWIRVGPRRAIADAQDERVLNEKRRHGNRPFDARPLPHAGIADLERRRFEDEYLPAAVADDVLAANERTYEQRLAALKMVVSAEVPTPTVLGALVLSGRARHLVPGAYVQFLRVGGASLADPIIDEQAIDGTVGDIVRRLDEKLNAHNRTAVDFTSGPREKRTSTYPVAALQQITRNAIMHRTYEGTHAPVRVYWFDDRLEVTSPGGPYGVVNIGNFASPGIADYRNPGLAEAMRVLGYAQGFGAGLAIARKALADNGNPPPEFTVNMSYVSVILRPVQ